MKVIDKTNEQLIAELEWVNTRQTHAEEELRESEEFSSSLLENLPDVVIIANPDTSIRYANPALERLTGYTSEEVVGKNTPYPWWICSKSPENADNPAKTVPDRVRTLEFYRKKGGETFWAEVTSVPVRHNGELQYYISSWVNVTEHKRAEENVREVETLKEIDRLRTELLANISHELRTPLTSIKGFSTMLVEYEEKLGRKEKREYLKAIDLSTDRLLELIDQLLDMSRLDAGILAIDNRPTNINKLLQDVVNAAQVRVSDHLFKLDLPKNLPRLSIDARRIRQVLENLIKNAVRYSKANTEIQIAVRRDIHELLISVADRGMGIPREELTRVFDRFFRSQRSQIEGKKGVGLGLSICKRLIEAQGGRIWIESEEGNGSTCFFTLPINIIPGEQDTEKS